MSPSIDLDEVRRLEHLAFAGWPALRTVDVAGWRLRFAGGYTKRANSINALSPEAQPGSEIVEHLESEVRRRGGSPVWRLSPLAPPAIDERLAARGYRTIERSLMQRAALDERFAHAPEVRIDPAPDAVWLATFAAASPVAERHRDTMRRLLAAMPAPTGFARIARDGSVLATAIGVVQGDHMGLFDVLVMPAGRRQGLARRLTESLYAWARTQGARFAYLQVVATNDAALPLYAAQGFRPVYDYIYRVPPAP